MGVGLLASPGLRVHALELIPIKYTCTWPAPIIQEEHGLAQSSR